jgi:BNR/Asp-box repeat
MGPRGLAAVTTALLLLGCGEANDEPSAPVTPSDPGVIHIHGLGRNPADGALFVATHTGLFRMGSRDRSAERVAGLYQDTMGFTVVGSDHFLGSGHPGSIENDPPFLGLIESRNAGASWRPISLRGDVDFHVLEAQGETVYGFGSDWNTREARFLRSDDRGRTWTRLTPPEGLLGLAIDPQDERLSVALGEESGWVSRDGGATWRPLPVPGGMVTWTKDLGLIAVDFEGVIRSAREPTGDWNEIGRLPGEPAALEGVRDELLAATHESQILSSHDRGRTWRDLLRE